MSPTSLLRSWWPVPVLAAAVAGFLLLSGHQVIDLAVYRMGGETARVSGSHLYAVTEPSTGLPFTYPPISAVLMIPLGLIPFSAAIVAWTLVTVAALALVVRLSLRSAGYDARPATVCAVSAGALALEPVWATITFGQVNLVLLALLLLDLLRPRGARLHGVLTGVAAAVKLTPLVFIVFLYLTGRRRAATTALATFFGCHLLGWLVLPRASAAYFGGVAFDPHRVGGVPFASNQSVLGVLTRLSGGEPSTLAWFLVAAALAGPVLLLAAHRWRHDPLLGTGLAGLSMLLASPISWSHHWVWCLPLSIALWRRSRVASVAWLAVFCSTCIFRVPTHDDRELAWTWWQQGVGNAYFWAALVLALGVAATSVRSQLRAGSIRPVTSPSVIRPPSVPGAV